MPEVSGCCISVHNTWHAFEGYMRFVYVCFLAVLQSDNCMYHGKEEINYIIK